MNKTMKFIPTIILNMVFVLFLNAQSDFKQMKNSDDLKKKLREMSKNTSTIQSKFTQEKNLSFLEDKIISDGEFLFKKEKLLRWEYVKPIEYLIIINNDKILIRNEGKSKTYDLKSNKIFKEINEIMIGTIQGTLFENDDKFKSTYYENEKLYFIKLIPNDNNLKQFLSEIHIYFDKDDLSVATIIMNESSGDYTKIEFIDRKMNVNIPDEKFNIN